MLKAMEHELEPLKTLSPKKPFSLQVNYLRYFCYSGRADLLQEQGAEVSEAPPCVHPTQEPPTRDNTFLQVSAASY